jgi:hypothetical protein
VPLRPDLQSLVETILKAHPDGLTLDELSEELAVKPLGYAEIDEIIGALEDAGVDLDGPPKPPRPEELGEVLAAVRALTVETGQRPTVAAIATRAGLTPAVVTRALRFGRALGGGEGGG